MSQSHSRHDGHQSEASKAAMHEQDQITVEKQHGMSTDALPPADNGSHAHSSAAHLKSEGHEHTKTEGDLQHGVQPGALREPPMEKKLAGKHHRD